MWNLRRLTLFQSGVLTRQQCLDAGVSDAAIAVRLRRGEWQRLEAGIYVAHGGPLPYETRLWAAALGVGGEVAVARESVLWWLDRAGRPPRDVHLSVARGRTVAPRQGVVVAHDLRPWTTLLVGGLTFTSGEDAVLDICARGVDARQVEATVCEAVRRKTARAGALSTALALRPRHPRRALLVDMLTEVEAGAQSPLELLDLRNDLAHGLPTAQRQVHQRAGGRGRWLDAVYTPLGAGRPVQKELDGRLGHEEAPGRFRDRRRDNAATLLGRDSLRYGWHELADEGCDVAAEALVLLRRNGFGEVGHPCGRTCSVPAPGAR